MLRSLLFLALSTYGFISPCEARHIGSQAMTSVTFQHKGFNAIHVSHVCQLQVRRAKVHSIKIKINANLRTYLRVELRGKELFVGLRQAQSYHNVTCRGEIGMPALQALKSSGASGLQVTGLGTQKSVKLSSSGASRLHLEGQFQALTLRASGSSRIQLKGKAKRLTARASGASRLQLEGLVAESAKVRSSGASRTRLQVTKQLQVRASGASRLHYTGKPQVTKDVSGVARVEG